ncbi:HAD-IIB family hydrolase [Porticoccaceae bacterium]|nr:HAD-IIB family hydrolase [Porticoccaceae bacterium]
MFTDLDGSLLDHHSYSFAPAVPLLAELEAMDVPVIPITSKTFTEVINLRDKLHNRHPFIIENGAAIYIPNRYFKTQPEHAVLENGFWVLRNVPRRAKWQQLLAERVADFKGEFETFESVYSTAGAAGIAAITGLDLNAAELANQREHSEPVHWVGSPQRKQSFIYRLKEAGATVLQGGRFLNIGGDVDKGRAMLQLRDLYLADVNLTRTDQQESNNSPCDTLAIGDSNNDAAMLELASSALVIRADDRSPPTLERTENSYTSQQTGPEGWVEGVSLWLQKNTKDAD